VAITHQEAEAEPGCPAPITGSTDTNQYDALV